MGAVRHFEGRGPLSAEGPSMGTLEQTEFFEQFEDIPTSEFIVDAQGNWIDLNEAIREEPSGVRRRASSQFDGTHQAPTALPAPSLVPERVAKTRTALLAGLLLILLLAFVAWLVSAPQQAVQLQQQELHPQSSEAWLLPLYDSAPAYESHVAGTAMVAPTPPSARPASVDQPGFEAVEHHIFLEPILIQASRPSDR